MRLHSTEMRTTKLAQRFPLLLFLISFFWTATVFPYSFSCAIFLFVLIPLFFLFSIYVIGMNWNMEQ